MKLKPKKATITFLYECPKCKSTQNVSEQETKTPDFKIVCWCGCVMEIDQILNIKIKYNVISNKIRFVHQGGLASPVAGSIINSHLYTGYIESAKRTLISCGYSEKETNELIGTVDITKCKTTGDIVRLALCQVKNV